MDKNKIIRTARKRLTKLLSVLLTLTMLLELSAAYINAVTYYTVRVNYLYTDGTHAHDPYIATFPAGGEVDVTVTNSTINGYDPMTLNAGETIPLDLPENGAQAKTIDVSVDALNSDITYTVYYVAGLSHYRARFYLQNIYDDLYTTDQTLNAKYQEKLGITGSFPDYLEEVEVEGFTSLFHEPDAIAADGSTVFRLYYDRNYYSVGFDFGEGGYGVEPIDAKYQTEYRIDEPKRVGYTFRGWVRTDADSAVEGTDWHYIDENGNVISEETATATENLLTLEGDLTVPAKDTYYKAVWAPGNTSCSVVYWFENADSDLKNTEEEFAGLTEEEIQAKVSKNYSVIAAKDVFNIYENGHERLIEPGMVITPDTVIRNKAKKAKDEGIYSGSGDNVIPIKDFFSFNLGYANPNDPRNNDDLAFDENGHHKPEALVYKYDKNGVIIDFNDISQGTSEQLVGNRNYFELNTAENTPIPNYRTDTSVTVRGDGMTRINIYFRRKPITLKFFYAKTKTSGSKTTVFLPSNTNPYSKNDANPNTQLKRLQNAVWENCIDTLPEIVSKYAQREKHPLTAQYIEDEQTHDKYWYYSVEKKLGANLRDVWLLDTFPAYEKKDKPGEYVNMGGWSVENGTYYQRGHDNITVKGIYEKLDTQLLFPNATKLETNFLLFWTNASYSKVIWNKDYEYIWNFTYKNYIELLPKELERMELDLNNDGQPDGKQGLIDDGVYVDVITRNFTDTDGISKTKTYGLTTEHVIETYDAGDQYTKAPNKAPTVPKKIEAVWNNQTPATLNGCQLEVYQTEGSGNKVKVVLNNNNTDVIWDGENDEEKLASHHCTINFFYRRRVYTLKYRNGNRKDESHNREIMFGAPLNAIYASGEHEGEYRYYWDNPNYFIPDLRDHYMFSGWYYTPYYFRQVDVNTATMPAYDMTFYAKWVPKKIDVVFYNNYNEYYEDNNRIVLGRDGEGNPLTKWTVEYGSYVPLNRIPADVDSGESTRPHLEPIAEHASFAGWYYIRNRIPKRFEPENVPVIALNAESTGENATFRLFAEWVTKDVAKYKVNYVRADDPETEVAPPTVGRAYVWKTRTFQAKSGDELSGKYKWTEEHENEGTNWWPTVNSHSIIVKANEEGEEFKPNEYTFTYIQKDKVHYRIQYLDADTHRPINPEGHDIEKISPHASVKEDARVIPGYIADPTSQTRKLQVSDIPRSYLTNHDRVQYSKRYSNNYKIVNEEKTYTNGRYLLKATAYLIKDNQVTLSNSVYVCLAEEAKKTLQSITAKLLPYTVENSRSGFYTGAATESEGFQ